MERIVSLELVVIAGMLWFAYIGSRLAKRFKIPEVTSFIILGIIIGPRVINLITPDLLKRLDFFTPLALGLITFGIGERLSLSSLKKVGFSTISVAIIEALSTGLLVSVLLLMFGASLPVAVLLGTIAAVTSPVTVRAVLKETRASGKFSDSLLTTVAINNVLSISGFAVLLPIASWRLLNQAHLSKAVLASVVAVGGATIAGLIIGFLLSFLVSRIQTSSELLLFVVAHVTLGIALAELLGFSLLLTTLIIGFVTVNFSIHPDEKERIFGAINVLESMVFAIFFIFAGASMHIELIPKVGIAAIVYITGRSLGKIGGSYGGAYLTKKYREINSWLFGTGLLPQGGIAIGLAVAAQLQLGSAGDKIMTVVLAAVVFFELVGPLALRSSLNKVGETGLAANEVDRGSYLAKKSFAKILVPTAGPVPASQMVGTIKSLAQKLGASLLVIYVQATKTEHDRKKGEQALAVFKKLEADEIKIETKTLYSANIASKIIEFARDEKVDLIVMGAAPVRWFRKRVLSTANQKVLLDAPCPVLEVPFKKRLP